MQVIDLFSGAGGLSLGFKLANFRISLSIEHEKAYYNTYRLNNPDCKCLNEDITTLNCVDIERNYVNGDEIDGIIGGPPCQGYSSVGNRNPNDPRNMLIFYFIKWVEFFQPEFYVMENVPGILSMDKGRVVKKIIRMYKDINYSCQVERLRALDHGIPQKRKRVFFIGFKENSKNIAIPDKNGNNAHLVKDALSDIVDITPFRKKCRDHMTMDYTCPPRTRYQEYLRKNSRKLTNHFAPNHGKTVSERISHIKQGENHSSLPKKFQLKSGYPNIYGRLHLDEPAGTITGNCGCISAPGRFIHPTQDRAISVREAARLQSFPDDYMFKGNLNQKYRQVGNAVPPLMALALARSIKQIL